MPKRWKIIHKCRMSAYLFPEFFLPPLAMALEAWPLRLRDLTWRLLLLLPEDEPEPERCRCPIGCRDARFTPVG